MFAAPCRLPIGNGERSRKESAYRKCSDIPLRIDGISEVILNVRSIRADPPFTGKTAIAILNRCREGHRLAQPMAPATSGSPETDVGGAGIRLSAFVSPRCEFVTVVIAWSNPLGALALRGMGLSGPRPQNEGGRIVGRAECRKQTGQRPLRGQGFALCRWNHRSSPIVLSLNCRLGEAGSSSPLAPLCPEPALLSVQPGVPSEMTSTPSGSSNKLMARHSIGSRPRIAPSVGELIDLAVPL